MLDSDERSTTTVTPKEARRFNIWDPEDAEAMVKHLDTEGYAVIASVADEASLAAGKNAFWDFWEDVKYRGPLDRKEPKTWGNWMANAASGIIIGSRGANHNDFLWNSRTLPGVKKTFAKVWNDDNLLVSFDAGGVFRPWSYNMQWLTNGGWWHVDQNACKGPTRQGRVTVQGLVTYYDATPQSGGLCIVPGSHLQHNEVCERQPTAKVKTDYVQIMPGDPILQSQQPVLVCCKAGDLILWDSRTVHCNTPALHLATYHVDKLSPSNTKDKPGVEDTVDPYNSRENADASLAVPTNSEPTVPASESKPVDKGLETTAGDKVDLIRLVAYVCMLPRSHATQECVERRKILFCHKIGTNHFPTEEMSWFNPKEKAAPWTSRADVLELVGYEPKEIERIQNGTYGSSGCVVC